MNLRNLTAPDQWTLSDNSLLRRILVCFLGEVITAVGIAICLEGKSGVDPFTAFLQGISPTQDLNPHPMSLLCFIFYRALLTIR